MLQLQRHTTTSNSRTSLFQFDASAWSAPAAQVQMRTVWSCDAEAMYDLLRGVGDQATSRTQSEWPGRVQMLS